MSNLSYVIIHAPCKNVCLLCQICPFFAAHAPCRKICLLCQIRPFFAAHAHAKKYVSYAKSVRSLPPMPHAEKYVSYVKYVHSLHVNCVRKRFQTAIFCVKELNIAYEQAKKVNRFFFCENL